MRDHITKLVARSTGLGTYSLLLPITSSQAWAGWYTLDDDSAARFGINPSTPDGWRIGSIRVTPKQGGGEVAVEVYKPRFRKLNEKAVLAWLNAQYLAICAFAQAKMAEDAKIHQESVDRQRAHAVAEYADQMLRSIVNSERPKRREPYAARLAALRAEIQAVHNMIDGLILADVKTLTPSDLPLAWAESVPVPYKDDPTFLADVTKTVALTEKLPSNGFSLWGH